MTGQNTRQLDKNEIGTEPKVMLTLHQAKELAGLIGTSISILTDKRGNSNQVISQLRRIRFILKEAELKENI